LFRFREFVGEMRTAIRAGTFAEFRARYRDVDRSTPQDEPAD
jgi:hypothetical protein